MTGAGSPAMLVRANTPANNEASIQPLRKDMLISSTIDERVVSLLLIADANARQAQAEGETSVGRRVRLAGRCAAASGVASPIAAAVSPPRRPLGILRIWRLIFAPLM